MVVAAHWIAPEANARWRSFCGIIFSSTFRPFFLKMPALSARVSGAKPVQPDMPSTILVSCAWALCAATAMQAVASAVFHRENGWDWVVDVMGSSSVKARKNGWANRLRYPLKTAK